MNDVISYFKVFPLLTKKALSSSSNPPCLRTFGFFYLSLPPLQAWRLGGVGEKSKGKAERGGGVTREKWSTIHNFISNKLHLTEEGLAQVRASQKQININNSMTNKTGSAHP